MSVTCGQCDARPSEPQGIIKKNLRRTEPGWVT